MTTVAGTPGRELQSVAASSFDAWVKYYRGDENTPNATISYYAKGALVALAFDLTLRSEGRGSLDDVMRRLWAEERRRADRRSRHRRRARGGRRPLVRGRARGLGARHRRAAAGRAAAALRRRRRAPAGDAGAAPRRARQRERADRREGHARAARRRRRADRPGRRRRADRRRRLAAAPPRRRAALRSRRRARRRCCVARDQRLLDLRFDPGLLAGDESGAVQLRRAETARAPRPGGSARHGSPAEPRSGHRAGAAPGGGVRWPWCVAVVLVHGWLTARLAERMAEIEAPRRGCRRGSRSPT